MEQFTELAKDILNLNQNIGNCESFILDCTNLAIDKEEFKKTIKILIFCVGTRRYDFKCPIYLKLDSNDIEMINYITNLIHFTGRKNQVKLLLDTNNIVKLEYLQPEYYINLRKAQNTDLLIKTATEYQLKVFIEKDDLIQSDFEGFNNIFSNYAQNLEYILCVAKQDCINARFILKYAISKTSKIKMRYSEVLTEEIIKLLPMENSREKMLELFQF